MRNRKRSRAGWGRIHHRHGETGPTRGCGQHRPQNRRDHVSGFLARRTYRCHHRQHLTRLLPRWASNHGYVVEASRRHALSSQKKRAATLAASPSFSATRLFSQSASHGPITRSWSVVPFVADVAFLAKPETGLLHINNRFQPALHNAPVPCSTDTCQAYNRYITGGLNHAGTKYRFQTKTA